MLGEVELIIDAKAELGEGPAWDADINRLYWVDILAMRIHTYDPVTREEGMLQLSEHIGAVVPRKEGGLIAATQSGFQLIDLSTGEITAIANPEVHLPNNRFNDGKCDPIGRFLAGTMAYDSTKGNGNLYSLEEDGEVKKLIEHVTTSNGIAFSPDGKIMYYIDTPTKQVVAFDYSLETGKISNKRIVVEIPDGMGFPDGMTSDSEGNLWIAHWEGSRITRWNPHTGNLLVSVPVPALKVTSCIFGGEDLDELYITTAKTGLDKVTLQKYPYSGGVFRLKTGVKGSPTFKFGK